MSVVHLKSEQIHATSVNKHTKSFKNVKLIKGEQYFEQIHQYARYENYDIYMNKWYINKCI